MSHGHVTVKIAGKNKRVWVSDKERCPKYKCFHPHDCPVQGGGGVRNSGERWMCLTNALRGCPDSPENVS